jgi:transcriptional regulator NrdR family protein
VVLTRSDHNREELTRVRCPWCGRENDRVVDSRLSDAGSAIRPVTTAQVQNVASRIEERVRRRGPVVTSQEVGLEVLAMLAKLDQVAYMRYASVYKDFQQITDFEKELGILLQKREPAKRRARA